MEEGDVELSIHHGRAQYQMSTDQNPSQRSVGCHGHFCYEDWDWALADGMVCGLGTVARKSKSKHAEQFGGLKYLGHNNPRVCKGKSTFCLVVSTTQGELQVWDKTGMQLTGMTACEFMIHTQG